MGAMSSSPWDPAQYERFRAERSQPFRDLLAGVRRRERPSVLDLGCGTGALTRELHLELGATRTLGVDSSASMLEKARALEPAPGLSFEQRRIEDALGGERFGLVFSNAALHWVDDHPALLARLSEGVEPGGELAVQVPANHDHASHRVAAALAREEPYREALAGWERVVPVLSPGAYAALLHELGYERPRVEMRVYAHLLPAPREVVEWVRGTTLTAYQRRLPAELWERFLADYEARLLPELPSSSPCFFPFQRILFWASRPA